MGLFRGSRVRGIVCEVRFVRGVLGEFREERFVFCFIVVLSMS